ncbi:hypothetical protein [Streptomyces sp. NPDC014006]|uniref:hypothetical protein n=1 Tax=Streptomyces sp. NPDC014006 TaxID=3364870 RepID=UPI0036F6E370
MRSRPMGGAAVIGLLFNFAFYGMVFTASLEFSNSAVTAPSAPVPRCSRRRR